MKKRIAIYCLGLAFLVNKVLAQGDSIKKIELIHADVLEYNQEAGNKAKRLIGQVHFKHDQTDMYCDSAYLYTEMNSLHAYGHVVILNNTGERLSGDSLRYDGNLKLAKLRGHVYMYEKERELNTQYVDYNLKENVAYYMGGGVLKNKKENSELKSTYGYYYTKKKEFFFKDQVELKHPDYQIWSDTLMHHTTRDITYFYGKTHIKTKHQDLYCYNGWFNQNKGTSYLKDRAQIIEKNREIKGDSIFYDNKKMFAEVFHHVSIIDTSEKICIQGQYAYYQEKDSSFFITQDALLSQYESKDTFYLHADTLESVYDTTYCARIFKAYRNSIVDKNDLQATCDSLVYIEQDSMIKMFYKPVLWSNENQLSGKYMEIYQYNGTIHSLWIYDSAWVVTKLDTLHYNQILSSKIKASFKDNALISMHGYADCKTKYYPEDKTSLIGQNTTFSEQLDIKLDSQEVKKITFIKPQKSQLIPMHQIAQEDLTLNGFAWFNTRREEKKSKISSLKKRYYLDK